MGREKKEKEGKKARGRPRKDSGVKRKYDVIENEKKKEQEEQIDLMNEEELYQGTRRKTRKPTMNNLEEREKTTTTKKAAAIATNGRLKQEKERKQQEKEKEKEKEEKQEDQILSNIVKKVSVSFFKLFGVNKRIQHKKEVFEGEE